MKTKAILATQSNKLVEYRVFVEVYSGVWHSTVVTTHPGVPAPPHDWIVKIWRERNANNSKWELEIEELISYSQDYYTPQIFLY
jgi:hypothetical protein